MNIGISRPASMGPGLLHVQHGLKGMLRPQAQLRAAPPQRSSDPRNAAQLSALRMTVKPDVKYTAPLTAPHATRLLPVMVVLSGSSSSSPSGPPPT
mmetsp:Transcript_39574/g.100369  ORF Transcript_39574/g.100369 Transcript_39574/m.100369 type:complete len:96 (-) Transcript_39574:37-324(-)